MNDANFNRSEIRNVDFSNSVVNGGTQFLGCKIDERTNFSGVDLQQARLDPGLRPLLEYALRRRHWEEWYRKNPLSRHIVWLFWLISDYGRSTRRIPIVFLGLALAFDALYWVTWDALVINLSTVASTDSPNQMIILPHGLALFPAFYFSITLMTIGFGDMYANPHGFWGHFLVIIQGLLGFLLLGALVTRLSVLFNTTAPANISLMDMYNTSWWLMFKRRFYKHKRSVQRRWRK